MSFDKILTRKGQSMSQIEIVRTNVGGYMDTSQNTTAITAIVQPLTSEERLFWSDAGITKAILKLYTDASMNVGDKITLNGKDYAVASIDNHEDVKMGGYWKVIVEKHG